MSDPRQLSPPMVEMYAKAIVALIKTGPPGSHEALFSSATARARSILASSLSDFHQIPLPGPTDPSKR